MDQIIEFFTGLFSTADWPPRWQCGVWSDFHGWLYITSDLLIWFAYFMIPLIILNYFNKKKEKIRFRRAYILFASFILLCGLTHFFDAVMFWVPMYRLNGLLRFCTAVASLLTVYYLVKVLPDLFVQKTNVELENEIAYRKEVELKLANANKNLEAFASIASHDLQEPLRKIAFFSSLLQERNADKFDEPSKQYNAKIISSSQKMQLLIKDILALSSLGNDVVMEKVDLQKPIEDALQQLDLKIKEKNARIQIQDLPVIYGNATYLSQLFYNLLSNSLKFTENDPVIHISAGQQNGFAVIRFTDNGIGIREENREIIFGAFQRLQNENKYEGTGLGLAICKNIVELHHGTIAVESNGDTGSVFVIQLPIEPIGAN